MNVEEIKSEIEKARTAILETESKGNLTAHEAWASIGKLAGHVRNLSRLLEMVANEGLHIKIQDLSNCPACGDDGDDVFIPVDNSGEGSAEQVVNCACGCEYVAKFTATVDVKYDSEWVKGGPTDEG